MSVKISPSVDPCFQLASVRSDGFGALIDAAILPSPLPVSPWQVAHCVSYSFLPAAIDVRRRLHRILQRRGFRVMMRAGLMLPAAHDRESCADSAEPSMQTVPQHRQATRAVIASIDPPSYSIIRRFCSAGESAPVRSPCCGAIR